VRENQVTMNDFLDAAALRSARTLKAVARTSFGTRVRSRAAVVRAVAETMRDLADERVQERLGRSVAEGLGEQDPALAAPTPRGHHGPLAPAAVGPLEPGDDERCTCSGTGENWCGATRRDVVHDLTTRGAKLSREQALHIWASAQAARAL
jgi:hypothetical protein